MINLNEFKTNSFELTDNEAAFTLTFLSNNGCGAATPDDLLGDNFSCQTFEDLVELFPEMSEAQIKGTLGSLVNKFVIFIEDDRGPENPWIQIKGKKQKMLPDLYWVSEAYLEELNPELNWYGR